jgi:hypothetical protein
MNAKNEKRQTKMNIKIFYSGLDKLKDDEGALDDGFSLDYNIYSPLSELNSHLMNDLDGGAPCIFDGANPILIFS